MAAMTAYQKLCELQKEVALVGSTAAVLDWDHATYLPEAASSHRGRQLSWLTAKAHALATGKKFRQLLDAAEREKPHGLKERLNIEQIRRENERASRLPSKLVAEESEARIAAKQAWAAARANADFAHFAPHLQRLVDFSRRKADLWGWKDEPYDALLENYERGSRTQEIAKLFQTLRPKLREISREAVESSRQRKRRSLSGHFPIELQQKLNAEVVHELGFDFNRGRIDTTLHPFCTRLGPHDVRLTTRYEEGNFLSSLFGVLHEAGHGLYEQGLPPDDEGLPSGTAASLSIHESQSRLWENHVGRSETFWQRWLPRAAEIFPKLRKWSLEDFMALVQESRYSFIRVEADEATYDLHILLRFDLERRIISGQLAIDDIPDAWNAEFKDLFGLSVPDAAQGCLQDIHWSLSDMGYFATYTLGNLSAAQLFAAARKRGAIRNGLESGDYSPLLTWLRGHVHERGGLLLPNQIIQDATGTPLDAKWHIRHLRQRYATA